MPTANLTGVAASSNRDYLRLRIDELHALADHAVETATALIKNNEQECITINAKMLQLKEQLVVASSEQTCASKELTTENQAKDQLVAELQAQEHGIRELEADINRENDEVERLRRALEEEQQRHNRLLPAWLSLFQPGRTVEFSSLVSSTMLAAANGDLNQTPVYQIVDGLISRMRGDLRAAEERLSRSQNDVSRLKERASETQQDILASRLKLSVLQEQVARAQERFDTREREIKAAGKELTRLGNTRLQLKKISEKCERVKQEFVAACEVDESSMISECLNDFHQLLLSLQMQIATHEGH